MSRRKREPAMRAPRARNGNAPQRRRLIDACISALHLYGPSRTTVARVVAIAKMSPGIVRFYFDSKAAMMVASLQFLAAEFEEQVLLPVTRLKATPVAALERLVELYLDPEIASPRKVSVWYAFWGEASSRQEYYDICGQKDASFAALVQELIERLIEESGQRHLDAGGVALGLIGVLEMLWQDFAFQSEENIDRGAARARALAYLRSVFPGCFGPDSTQRALPRWRTLAPWTYGTDAALSIEREAIFRASAQVIGHERELERPGAYLTADTGAERVLVVRGADGRIHALRDACPQAPHALAPEPRGCFAAAIECPLHGLAFTFEGAVRSGSAAPLARLDLEIINGLLIVRGAAAGERDDELETALRAAPAQLLPEQAPAPVTIEANWKIVVEQWLEGLEPGLAACSESWSARRYRGLAGLRAGFEGRFLAPNQWLERRPDGCSIVRIVPIACGVSHLERLDLALAACPYDERTRRALQYLARRLTPQSRRAARRLAASTQQGRVAFAYGARQGNPALEDFHHGLIRRAPALGLDRAPAAS